MRNPPLGPSIEKKSPFSERPKIFFLFHFKLLQAKVLAATLWFWSIRGRSLPCGLFSALIGSFLNHILDHNFPFFNFEFFYRLKYVPPTVYLAVTG